MFFMNQFLGRWQMLTRVEGIYRNGQVEWTEHPPDGVEGARVIVTFVESGEIDLATEGIDRTEAEVLRGNLATFAEDWESPEMNIYDNYDAARIRSQAG
jgi:hypothetical protein